MRLLLDTNVLIAALITRGVCSDLLEHCILQHELVTSEFILDELHEHLLGKFKYSLDDTEAAVELLRSRMRVVEPATLEARISRDPDDDVVLATALAGQVECIVTGDKDLLALKRFGSVNIVSPSEFPAYEGSK